MIQQAFIDMPNLLNIQRPKRQPTRLYATAARNPNLQNLQRFEQMQDNSIVDSQRLCSVPF
jgi:hypothetical protein